MEGSVSTMEGSLLNVRVYLAYRVVFLLTHIFSHLRPSAGPGGTEGDLAARWHHEWVGKRSCVQCAVFFPLTGAFTACDAPLRVRTRTHHCLHLAPVVGRKNMDPKAHVQRFAALHCGTTGKHLQCS